jgi:hypothetical protein
MYIFTLYVLHTYRHGYRLPQWLKAIDDESASFLVKFLSTAITQKENFLKGHQCTKLSPEL